MDHFYCRPVARMVQSVVFCRSNCKPHVLLYNNRIVSYQEIGDADKAAADFAKAKELGYETDDE